MFNLIEPNFHMDDVMKSKIQNILVFNIPKRAFEIHPNEWRNMKFDGPDGIFSKILYSIAYIVQRRDMGTIQSKRQNQAPETSDTLNEDSSFADDDESRSSLDTAFTAAALLGQRGGFNGGSTNNNNHHHNIAGEHNREDTIIDPLYFDRTTPKTVQMLERLTNTRKEFAGWRVWNFVLDPRFDFGTGFVKMITDNMKKKPVVTQKSSGSSSGGSSNQKAVERWKCYSDIDSLDCLKSIWHLYTENQTSDFTSSNGRDDDDDFDPRDSIPNIALFQKNRITDNIGSKTSPLNPYNVLSPVNAMEYNVEDVCDEQIDINTYFNSIRGGITPRTFKGFESDTGRMFKLNIRYFEPSYIYMSPLPDILDDHVIRKSKLVQEMSNEIKDSKKNKKNLEDDRINSPSESERKELDSMITELEETIRMRQITRDNMMQQIRDFQSNAMKIAQDYYPSLKDIGLQPEMIEKNDFLKLRIENLNALKKLEEMYEKNSVRYENELENWRVNAIREFWKIFMESNSLPAPVKNIRKWFQQLRPDQKWAEWNLAFMDEEISPYANMVIKMCGIFGRFCKIDTDFKLMYILLLVGTCASTYGFTLKPNAFLTGEGDVGKSQKLDSLESMMTPGTCMSVTNITQSAFNTDEEASDYVLIIHEMPLHLLGIDKYGNEVCSDPFFKNRLTKQFSITLSFSKEKGVDGVGESRRCKKTINRCNGTTVAACNEKITKNALFSRFLVFNMKRKERIDVTTQDHIFAASWTANASIEQNMKHEMNLITFYSFLLNKANEVGIIPDVNDDTARYVANRVFDNLKENGISYPARRPTFMYYELVGAMTRMYSIVMEFFSELGKNHRVDPKTNEYKDFYPELLLKLIKWQVAPQEIAVHILTVMEEHWVPLFKLQVVQACSKAYHMWPYNAESTRFRVEGTSSTSPINNNYIQISSSSMRQISNTIRDYLLDSQPSTNDIESCLHSLYSDFLEVYPREVIDDTDRGLFNELRRFLSSREDIVKRALLTASIAAEEEEEHPVQFFDSNGTLITIDESTNNNNYDDDNDNITIADYDDQSQQQQQQQKKKNFYRPSLQEMLRANFTPERGDATEYCFQTLKKLVDTKVFDRIYSKVVDSHTLKYFLVERKDLEKIKIPSVIYDGGSKKLDNGVKLYIAVELLERCYESALETALDSLSHRHSHPQTMITGFNVTETGENNRSQCYYHVFKTKRIETNDTVILIPNKFHISHFDVAVMYNKTESKGIKEFQSNFDPFTTRVASFLDQDIDIVQTERFWVMNCVTDRDGRRDLAQPHNTKKAIWEIRKNDPRYEKSALLMMGTYPDSVLKEIRGVKLKYNEMLDNAEASGLKYSDMNSEAKYIERFRSKNPLPPPPLRLTDEAYKKKQLNNSKLEESIMENFMKMVNENRLKYSNPCDSNSNGNDNNNKKKQQQQQQQQKRNDMIVFDGPVNLQSIVPTPYKKPQSPLVLSSKNFPPTFIIKTPQEQERERKRQELAAIVKQNSPSHLMPSLPQSKSIFSAIVDSSIDPLTSNSSSSLLKKNKRRVIEDDDDDDEDSMHISNTNEVDQSKRMKINTNVLSS